MQEIRVSCVVSLFPAFEMQQHMFRASPNPWSKSALHLQLRISSQVPLCFLHFGRSTLGTLPLLVLGTKCGSSTSDPALCNSCSPCNPSLKFTFTRMQRGHTPSISSMQYAPLCPIRVKYVGLFACLLVVKFICAFQWLYAGSYI